MATRLQHVSIPRPPNSDDETRAFYSGLIGLEEKPAPLSIQNLGLIWFKVGGDLELHCFSEDPLHDESRRHLCLVVDDVHSLRKTLEDAGYEPYDAPAIPGRPRFFCRDPFRNILEFTTIEADYLDLEAE